MCHIFDMMIISSNDYSSNPNPINHCTRSWCLIRYALDWQMVWLNLILRKCHNNEDTNDLITLNVLKLQNSTVPARRFKLYPLRGKREVVVSGMPSMIFQLLSHFWRTPHPIDTLFLPLQDDTKNPILDAQWGPSGANDVKMFVVLFDFNQRYSIIVLEHAYSGLKYLAMIALNCQKHRLEEMSTNFLADSQNNRWWKVSKKYMTTPNKLFMFLFPLADVYGIN